MRSTKLIRAARDGYIALSAALGALGILMMVYPGMSAVVIGVIVAIALIAFGVVKLIGYFSKDLYRLAFQFDLAFGILLIVLGAVILIRPGFAMSVLCVILGVEIVTDGLFKLQTALDAKAFGLERWWLIFGLSVLAGAIGVALVVRPSENARILTVLLGASLLMEGLVNLSVALCAVKIISHQQADVVGETLLGHRNI